jgi:hypothetical protein
MNANEKRLLLVFALIVFVAANVLGFFWYSGHMRRLNSKKNALTLSKNELTIWKEQAPAAEGKRQWIADNVATYADDIVRESYLLSFLEGEATNGLNLTITKNKPGETKLDEHFTRSIYEATVRGPWTDVMDFVYRLQSPKAMHFVKELRLMPKKNEANDKEMDVECSFVIEKWWDPRPDGPIETEPVEEPAAKSDVAASADERRPIAGVEAGKPPTPVTTP